MMNLCKILVSKNSNILVTFIVPEKRSSRLVSKRKKEKRKKKEMIKSN